MPSPKNSPMIQYIRYTTQKSVCFLLKCITSRLQFRREAGKRGESDWVKGWYVLRWMDSARIELWLENGFGSGFETDGNWLAFEPGIMLYAPHYVDASESWNFAWRLKSLHLISQRVLQLLWFPMFDGSSHMVAHLNPSSILQLDSTFHRLQAEAQSQNM